jgi:hypothetical protein
VTGQGPRYSKGHRLLECTSPALIGRSVACAAAWRPCVARVARLTCDGWYRCRPMNGSTRPAWRGDGVDREWLLKLIVAQLGLAMEECVVWVSK